MPILSWADDAGRVHVIVMGAVSTMKKAENQADNILIPELNSWDPGLLAIIKNGSSDNASTAMKCVHHILDNFYGCDAHVYDLMWGAINEYIVGTQDGIGSIKLIQGLFDLGYW
jgi:hypothetical protein